MKDSDLQYPSDKDCASIHSAASSCNQKAVSLRVTPQRFTHFVAKRHLMSLAGGRPLPDEAIPLPTGRLLRKERSQRHGQQESSRLR